MQLEPKANKRILTKVVGFSHFFSWMTGYETSNEISVLIKKFSQIALNQ
jgi:hypothetical protein